jgi:hypothetical protein
MAGAGFTTFTAGSVLTATQVNTYLMQQAVMVFTNEAARDAAITSPSKGMIAYLTTPTVPTSNAGAKTIYNGSVWVCVTPQNNVVLTKQGNYLAGTYVDLATVGPSVTLVTGTTALVTLSATLYTQSADRCYAGVAVSGASTIAGTNNFSCSLYSRDAAASDNSIASVSYTGIITGLTAGTNIFTMKYAATASNFMSASNRSLTVTGVA